MEIGTGMSDSASPTGPPYSPITPVMSNTMPVEGSQEYHQPMPPLEPFSESDNPDAIALRSAISVLLIQRQQTLRDLKTLERQKRAAVADPEAFSSAVVQGRVKTRSKGVLDAQPDFAPSYLRDAEASNGQEESDTQTSQHSHSHAFDDIPGPQNVVRCPPINWAKYHIVGKPLDVLHEEQRKRPLSNQDCGNSPPPKRAEEHKIAAPYNPWQDRLGTTTTRQPD